MRNQGPCMGMPWGWRQSGSLVAPDVNEIPAPGRLCCMVSKSSSQSISGSTWTKVTWDVEIHDDDNIFASDAFTSPIAGKFALSPNIQFASSGYAQVAIRKNGGGNEDYLWVHAYNDYVFCICSRFIVSAQIGDYFEVWVYMAGSTNIVGGAGQESSSLCVEEI